MEQNTDELSEEFGKMFELKLIGVLAGSSYFDVVHRKTGHKVAGLQFISLLNGDMGVGFQPLNKDGTADTDGESWTEQSYDTNNDPDSISVRIMRSTLDRWNEKERGA